MAYCAVPRTSIQSHISYQSYADIIRHWCIGVFHKSYLTNISDNIADPKYGIVLPSVQPMSGHLEVGCPRDPSQDMVVGHTDRRVDDDEVRNIVVY